MKEIVSEILTRLRESVDYEEIAPGSMRSYVHIGVCCNCNACRVLDRHGRCEKCGSDSIIHRVPQRFYERGDAADVN